jgi:multisubunit Na+/H+ antiporter MnhG subunit
MGDHRRDAVVPGHFLRTDALADAVAAGSGARLAGYASFVIALFGVSLFARHRAPTAARDLAVAGFIFAVSLTLRSIDQAVCPELPIGTHFLWHMLNAVVLYVLLRAAMRGNAKVSRRT